MENMILKLKANKLEVPSPIEASRANNLKLGSEPRDEEEKLFSLLLTETSKNIPTQNRPPSLPPDETAQPPSSSINYDHPVAGDGSISPFFKHTIDAQSQQFQNQAMLPGDPNSTNDDMSEELARPWNTDKSFNENSRAYINASRDRQSGYPSHLNNQDQTSDAIQFVKNNPQPEIPVDGDPLSNLSVASHSLQNQSDAERNAEEKAGGPERIRLTGRQSVWDENRVPVLMEDRLTVNSSGHHPVRAGVKAVEVVSHLPTRDGSAEELVKNSFEQNEPALHKPFNNWGVTSLDTDAPDNSLDTVSYSNESLNDVEPSVSPPPSAEGRSVGTTASEVVEELSIRVEPSEGTVTARATVASLAEAAPATDRSAPAGLQEPNVSPPPSTEGLSMRAAASEVVEGLSVQVEPSKGMVTDRATASPRVEMIPANEKPIQPRHAWGTFSPNEGLTRLTNLNNGNRPAASMNDEAQSTYGAEASPTQRLINDTGDGNPSRWFSSEGGYYRSVFNGSKDFIDASSSKAHLISDGDTGLTLLRETPATTIMHEQKTEQVGTKEHSTLPATTPVPEEAPSGPERSAPAKAYSARIVMDEVVNGVFRVLRKNNTGITLKLKPESLGGVELEVTIRDRGVTSHFIAQTVEAKELIEANINRLRQALQDQNLRLEEFTISVDRDREWSEGRQGGFHTRGNASQGRERRATAEQQGNDQSFNQVSRSLRPWNIEIVV